MARQGVARQGVAAQGKAWQGFFYFVFPSAWRVTTVSTRPLKFRANHFRDLILVGEGAEDIQKVEQHIERTKEQRASHEVSSRQIVEAFKLKSSTPIVNGKALTTEQVAKNKLSARRGGLISRALRKLRSLADWNEVNRRSGKARQPPAEYVLSEEEKLLLQERGSPKK